MSKEIKKTTKLSWSKGGAEIVVNVDETLDQTGEQAIENVQVIQGVSEALTFGDVSAPAHVAFKNLNPKWSTLTTEEKAGYASEADYNTKNTVYIGTANPTNSGNAMHKLTPGGGAQFLAISVTWFACKDTDNVNLLVAAIEV
jgi:hypothetical protein